MITIFQAILMSDMIKDKRLLEALAEAGITFAAKPPKIVEVRFAKPEIIEPVIISKSGQERRRDRRKKERESKRKQILRTKVEKIDANVLEELCKQVGFGEYPKPLGNGLYKLEGGAIVGEYLMQKIVEITKTNKI